MTDDSIRQWTRIGKLFVVVALLLVAAGCDGEDRLTIVSYNVQNIFDDKDDGGEYEEYTTSFGWTSDSYFERLSRLAQVLQVCEAPPHVVVMQEIEDVQVLDDLRLDHVRQRRYAAIAAPSEDTATTVGVLSTQPIRSARSHRSVVARVGGETAVSRPLFELEIEVAGRPLRLYCVHWKSQSGGEEVTEPRRCQEAALLNVVIAERRERQGAHSIIVIGDFNEDVAEYEQHAKSYQTALVPAAAAGGLVEPARSLLFEPVDPGRPAGTPVPLASAGVLYSPWPDSRYAGTYFYHGSWERLDQLFVSRELADGNDLELLDFAVLDRGPHVNAAGYPIRYERYSLSGYADHLPIVATLGEREQ